MKIQLNKFNFVKSLALMAFASGIVLTGAKAQTIVTPDNAGFQTPDVSTSQNGFATPSELNTADGSGWQYNYFFNPVFPGGNGLSGTTGINADGQGFGSSNSTGGQSAILQGTQALAQTITTQLTGLTTVSFSLESRGFDANNPEGGSTVNPVSVYFAPTADVTDPAAFILLGTFTPLSTTVFTPFTTLPIDLAAGQYVLDFQGTESNGLTSFLDDVSITTAIPPTVGVPEPSVMYLGGIGFVLLLVLGARRRLNV